MTIRPTFYPKHRPDMMGWYYFVNALSDKDIENVNLLADKFAAVEGKISSGADGEDLHEIRRSSITWLPAADERTHWVYNMLEQYMRSANEEMWGFDLTTLNDDIQYTEYDAADSGYYGWHADIGPDELALRKLTLVVQLSDPGEYEGGDFQIMKGNTPEVLPKTKGTAVLFPSYIMHQVTPVTKGKRRSLVLWAGGQSFR